MSDAASAMWNATKPAVRWAEYARQFCLSVNEVKRLRKKNAMLDQLDGCKDDAARRLVLGIFGGTRGQDADDDGSF
jgi:hypothetical protein